MVCFTVNLVESVFARKVAMCSGYIFQTELFLGDAALNMKRATKETRTHRREQIMPFRTLKNRAESVDFSTFNIHPLIRGFSLLFFSFPSAN